MITAEVRLKERLKKASGPHDLIPFLRGTKRGISFTIVAGFSIHQKELLPERLSSSWRNC